MELLSYPNYNPTYNRHTKSPVINLLNHKKELQKGTLGSTVPGAPSMD